MSTDHYQLTTHGALIGEVLTAFQPLAERIDMIERLLAMPDGSIEPPSAAEAFRAGLLKELAWLHSPGAQAAIEQQQRRLIESHGAERIEAIVSADKSEAQLLAAFGALERYGR